MRIVALADSLSLPRDTDGELLRWEETWPRRLERRLRERGVEAEVINAGRRARTADTLDGADFDEHVVYTKPDVVVLQVGVVDGAPRIFSRREQRVLRWLPAGLRDRIVRRRSARRAELTRKAPLARVYTPPEAFEAHLLRLGGRLRERGVQLVVVPILADLDRMEARSPGYTANIARYNTILARAAEKLGATFVSGEGVFGFCADGYHLDAAGSDQLAQRVADVLTR
jgi:lysophospholipase L1-like esterase